MRQTSPGQSEPFTPSSPAPVLPFTHAGPVPAVPKLDAEVCEALHKLGRPSAPGPGVDALTFERQLQTDLMVVFQRTRSHAVFNVLHRRTSPLILAWVKGLLKNRFGGADPHELVQDTFVNIYSYADSFREGGSHTFMGWARTIAANVMRRALRRGRTVSILETDQHVDQRPGPTCLAQYSEEVEAVRQAWTLFLALYLAAFQTLGPRDQKALHLTEVEGKDYDEVAKELGVGRRNVKMIMFRARKRVQASMRCQLMMAEYDSVRDAG
ncbi:MAG: sigma-70 family RNA polymerase sigma factor [bacterium]